MTALIWFIDIWTMDPEFPINDATIAMYNALHDNATRKIKGCSKQWKSINLTRYISEVSQGDY